MHIRYDSTGLISFESITTNARFDAAGNLEFPNGHAIEIDEIRAFDGAGLGLKNDGSEGFDLLDAGGHLRANGAGVRLEVPIIRARDSGGISITDDAGGLGIFIQDATGHVGIGTNSPASSGGGVALDINGTALRLRTARTPANAGATGNQGETCWDANYEYHCIATNTWRRTAHATW